MAERRSVHSLDGHCRPFNSVGQGTIFGSGIGAVLLKPLQQAVADRDHIFAVIERNRGQQRRFSQKQLHRSRVSASRLRR